ncbi:hypothetical protein V5T82_07260 [Magnetovibrio sp. PR-2]|uniref:hypothetical protein n=1 Tax=Magnetovibrio sp. PR-2 TaxID=3120356 RepID=UPI002FCE1F35
MTETTTTDTQTPEHKQEQAPATTQDDTGLAGMISDPGPSQDQTQTDTTVTDTTVTETTDTTMDVSMGELDIAAVPEKFIDKDTGTLKINELVDSYKNAESELGKARRNPQGEVPDSYDFESTFDEINARMDQDGTGFKMELLGEQERAEWQDTFRDLNLPQDTVNVLLNKYADRVTQMMASMGPHVDAQHEIGTLQREWGPEAKNRADQVVDFARTLPPEVFNMPLKSTAEGMKFLETVMATKRGPGDGPVDAGAANPTDIKAEIQTLMDDPAYWTDTDRGRQLQSKVQKLSARIS